MNKFSVGDEVFHSKSGKIYTILSRIAESVFISELKDPLVRHFYECYSLAPGIIGSSRFEEAELEIFLGKESLELKISEIKEKSSELDLLKEELSEELKK